MSLQICQNSRFDELISIRILFYSFACATRMYGDSIEKLHQNDIYQDANKNETKIDNKSTKNNDLQGKIRDTYKTIEHLRKCLAVAKENLEVERIQSQNLLQGYPTLQVSFVNLKFIVT